MMIVEIREIENCFDGSFMKEVLLDTPIDMHFIEYLGQYGELQYFRDFAKPFYRLDNPEKYVIKGIEGNYSLRIILNRTGLENNLQSFREIIESYNSLKTKITD